MKRLLIALAAVLLIAPLSPTACKTASAPVAVAPGYLSAADQTMGEILAGAHAFYNSVQTQSSNGTMTLTPTEKTAFNTFGTALNSAQIIYLAYHANPTQANLTAAQNAVNQVQTQQAALPQPGVK